MSDMVERGNITQQKIRVGVIFGGRSGEHEVSLMSARSVLSVLDSEKYNITTIGIDHDDHGFSRGLQHREQTPGLGPRCVQILGVLEQQARSGLTILVVTHNREISRVADRVIELSSGRIVADAVV